MSHPSTCNQCGGANLEPGNIQSTGKIYFRPANSKFLTLRTGDIEVKANVCLDCGDVQLVADTRKLAALTERVKPYSFTR